MPASGRCGPCGNKLTRLSCQGEGEVSSGESFSDPPGRQRDLLPMLAVCSRTTVPQDAVLWEPSEVPEIMRNLPPFAKSPGKNDELGAESRAPIRRSVGPCATVTPPGRRTPRWAAIARRVGVPSDERQSTRSMLDGCGHSLHDGCSSTAGMGKKCRDGFSDGGISHVDARMWDTGSTLGALRMTFLAVRARQGSGASAGASRCNRRGRSPRCLWARMQDPGPASRVEAVLRRARAERLVAGSRSEQMETNQELRVV